MTQTKQMLYTEKVDFNKIAENFGISPATTRIIRNWGIEDMGSIRRYLHGSVEGLHGPRLLPGMEEAISILRRKTAEGKTIRIVGDYDVDGVCSAYLFYRALERVGARVDCEIPDRIKDGYGINGTIIEVIASDGTDIVLTCDNGITAVSQIARAKELGVTVIVTDHRDILVEENEEDLPEGGREVLPPADTVVNPKLRGYAHPFTSIYDGTVAFKPVQVLFGESGVLAQEWLSILEVATITTVGDMMKLQGENRIIVKEGPRCLGHTSNLGLKKLIEKNNLVPGLITVRHIEFVTGPCLDANGHLQTAKIASPLLLYEDKEEAGRMTMKLKELNDRKKDMTQTGVDQAAATVEERYGDDKILVAFLSDCHELLAETVAGRLRERHSKPSFVLTRAEDCAKGSERSIETYHMFHALAKVRDLLLKFGGHPMATGFSLEKKNVNKFRRYLNENARECLTEEDFIPKVWIDVAMPLEYIMGLLTGELELLEPCEWGNEESQSAQKSIVIRSAHVMGRNRNVMRLSLVNEWGISMDGVVFTDEDLFMEEKGNSRLMDVIYHPGINGYNGNRNLQIVVRD